MWTRRLAVILPMAVSIGFVAVLMLGLSVETASGQQPPLATTAVIGGLPDPDVPLVNLPVVIEVAETVGILDNTGVEPAVQINIQESVAVSDDTGVEPAVQINIQETVVVGDSVRPSIGAAEPDPQAIDPTLAEDGPRGRVEGRAVIGTVVEVSTGAVTVSTQQGLVRLIADANTLVSAPPLRDVGLGAILTDPPSRLAVLVDRASEGGSLWNEPVPAVRITVIPSKSTRRHLRVVVTEAPTEDSIKFINATGGATELAAKNVDGVETGDSVFVLVGRSFTGLERVIAARDALSVTRRMLRLAQEAAAGTGDPSKRAPLLKLLEQHQDSKRNQLQQILDRATTQGIKESIEETMQALRGGPGDISEQLERAERLKLEIDDLGASSDSDEEISEAEESRALPSNSICNLPEYILPTVRITSPREGSIVLFGAVITISAEAEDDKEVIDWIEFVVNDVDLGIYTPAEARSGVEYPVPLGSGALIIEATARDACANTATDTLRVGVLQSSPPSVDIDSPVEGEELIGGSAVTVEVKADDDGQVVSVEAVLTAGAEQSSWILQPPAQKLPGMDWRGTVSIPNFIGRITLVVMATDNDGNTATESIALNVGSDPPPVVRIVSPVAGMTVEAGSEIDVKVEASDNGEIGMVEIEWTIVGDLGFPKLIDGLWTTQTTVPAGEPPSDIISSFVLPHVFVGSVEIGGVPAPDGTEVVAWVEGGPATTLELVARATDDSGQQGEDTVTVAVLPGLIRVASTTVIDGLYSLVVGQLEGESFAGRRVTFRVNGVDAVESMVWSAGGADVNPISLPALAAV